ncbi:DUF3772 domain-containing protein [Aestuariibius insulae]|uniref:DUF3772 domain-containing protein n=1 Tax=Aestuariibius insulae TaxID=2058287 RepID=UPI00345ED04F
MRRLLTLFCVVLHFSGSLAWAQDGDDVDLLASWDSTAAEAEAIIQEDEASTTALETLRAELARQRDLFLQAQSTNAARIDTVRSQIRALGPAPADGETEPEDVAARRNDLERQLVSLRRPVIEAEEAFIRADGLIGEIDSIIRDRQTEALLEVGPSPLNPVHWPEAFGALGSYLSGIASEVRASLAAPATRQLFRDRLPLTFAYLAAALVLLMRGRIWMERLAGLVVARSSRGRGVWRFVLSLGQIILPMAGLFAVTNALEAMSLFGPRGAALIDEIPALGFLIIIARWFSNALFPKRPLDPSEQPAFEMTRPQTREMRSYLLILSLLLFGAGTLAIMADRADFSPETVAVLQFPLLVMIGVILFRIGQIIVQLSRQASTSEEEPSEGNLRDSIKRFIGRAAMAIAVIAPVLAGLGYGTAADAILPPTVLSLALVGLLVVLIRLVYDVYALVTGADNGARDALMPVLIGFLIVLGCLPIFALIWGARIADLTELWAQIREGFALGETRIRPSDFLWFAVVFGIGYAATRLLQSALRTTVLPRTRLDIGGSNAIVAGTGYVGIFLAALVAITSAGIDLSNIAIVAGALSVGIGFGLQTVVSNFVSGIILLIERPISEGDWIQVGTQMGYVRRISVRSTRIETFDRTDVIVPNADLVSGTVTNFTHGNNVGRVIIPVGVAYGTDTKKVEAVLREIAEAHPMVILNPPPAILMRGFGADSLDFEIRAILRDVNWLLSVQSDLCHEIARRFAEEAIEIPFAQRDLWIRNPETLTSASD